MSELTSLALCFTAAFAKLDKAGDGSAALSPDLFKTYADSTLNGVLEDWIALDDKQRKEKEEKLGAGQWNACPISSQKTGLVHQRKLDKLNAWIKPKTRVTEQKIRAVERGLPVRTRLSPIEYARHTLDRPPVAAVPFPDPLPFIPNSALDYFTASSEDAMDTSPSSLSSDSAKSLELNMAESSPLSLPQVVSEEADLQELQEIYSRDRASPSFEGIFQLSAVPEPTPSIAPFNPNESTRPENMPWLENCPTSGNYRHVGTQDETMTDVFAQQVEDPWPMDSEKASPMNYDFGPSYVIHEIAYGYTNFGGEQYTHVDGIPIPEAIIRATPRSVPNFPMHHKD
jgi:hypothetical protein